MCAGWVNLLDPFAADEPGQVRVRARSVLGDGRRVPSSPSCFTGIALALGAAQIAVRRFS